MSRVVMLMRVHTSLLVLAGLALPVMATAQPARGEAPARVVVEDFEQGIGRWFTNDDQAAGTRPSGKCAIHAVSGGAPDGGRQAARIEFTRSTTGWASVSVPVEGRKWAQAGCSKLAMWIRGDGSGEPLRVVLRVQTTQPARDVAYSQVIRLDGAAWERFSFRFFGFTDTAGTALAPADIQHIRLLQFARNGSWGSFRFRVDEIVAEAEPGGPPIPPPDATTPGKVITITPDFGRPGMPALAQIGVNLGGLPTILDATDGDASAWAAALVGDLGPCVVRLQLGDYFEARREAYNLELLNRHMDWVQRQNCRPLVCFDPPRAPEDQPQQKARLFEVFVRAVSELVAGRAGRGPPPYYEILDSPLVTGTFTDLDHVIGAYNTLADLVLAADPRARVGGPGFSSAWEDRIRRFLTGARRLHFLSFHFYGAHNVITDSETLFEASYRTRPSDLPNQLSFQEVKALVKTLRRDNPEVFVTEFALNSARDERGLSRDERASTAFGAAWLAAALISGTPYVDKVLHWKLAPGGWGMISHGGTPETPYWAAWLMKNFAPRGSQHLQAMVLDDFTVAAAIKTRTAFNLIIARGATDPVELRIIPRNLPPLGQVRDRRVGEADRQWRGTILPLTANQTLLMDGAGVLVIQYIPRKD